jgi:hypothetical protein
MLSLNRLWPGILGFGMALVASGHFAAAQSAASTAPVNRSLLDKYCVTCTMTGLRPAGLRSTKSMSEM